MSSGAGPALTIERYAPPHQGVWDSFVRASKNGTFLFNRRYMDYHADRFQDHSLIVSSGKGIVALLPANSVGKELHTHQGLTYGGLVVSDEMTTPLMLDLFEALAGHLRRKGFRRLHYKTVPPIYHRLPAEEDRYALFRAGAVLVRRDVLSVIPAGRRGPVQARRRRGAVKAEKLGVLVREAEHWAPYWAMLTRHLAGRYGVAPVHTLSEIELLRDRFPAEIRLFEGVFEDQVVAGVVVFESPMVAHVQYIASSSRGREIGALDAVFHHLLERIFKEKPFFDFGISNEQQGRFLNRGLIEQKEGFGGRAVVHDFLALSLE
jgi:hypothetical protein